jgi:hypothetical protein
MAINVYRSSYRAHLRKEPSSDFNTALDAAKRDCQVLFDTGRAMVAGLFRYGRQLYAYCETIGESALPPEAFFGPLSSFLLDGLAGNIRASGCI